MSNLLIATFCCLSAGADGVAAGEDADGLPPIGQVQLPDDLRKIYFDGETPTVEQLRQMDQYQQHICRRLMQVTVGIRIGKTNGSGVIISPDGYVLTAAHVAERPGLRAVISLSDGRQPFGTTLGMNRSLDAALIKLDDPIKPPDLGTQKPPVGQSSSAGPWPFAAVGDLNDLRPNTWCLAMGHPGGFQPDRAPVVRLGHLLYLNESEIRTDCELTGGDSGGPLFDLAGRVIGIHSRIGSQLSKNLHVPISTYRKDWQRMASSQLWGSPLDLFGSPGPPAIGVLGEPDSNLPHVASVVRNSPAERAGILAGDLFLQFDGKQIPTFDALKKQVLAHSPGETVDVEVRRSGKLVQLSLTIGKLQEKPARGK